MTESTSMQRTVRKLLLPVLAVAAVLAGGADRAQAQFTVEYSPDFYANENTGATATVDYSFVQGTGVDADNVIMNWTITNTTDGTAGMGATEATLVGIAFDLLGAGTGSQLSVKSYNANSTKFTKLWTNLGFSPFGTYQYGISLNRNQFEGGNANDGLKAGQSISVSFILTGASPLVAAAVETAIKTAIIDGDAQVAARFQQVNAGAGSDKVKGGIDGGIEEVVPEPATVVLYALGLTGALGMGLARRRRNRLSA